MSTSTAEHDSYLRYGDPYRFFERADDKKHYDILRKREVDSQAFLELTEEKLLASPYNFPGGPAIKLAKEIKAFKEKPKRPFFSCKSLSEVLAKYDINSDSITSIPQFKSEPYPIEENIDDILRRIKNMGPVVARRHDHVYDIFDNFIQVKS